MEECYFCGDSEGETFLFDAISDEGIVKICRNCYSKEKLPLIKKEDSLFKGPEQDSVYGRLSKISGVNIKNRVKSNSKDLELKRIVEENFSENLSRVPPIEAEEIGLIRNFHWNIMRARRAKHLTQKQLAETISEPEIAIKMIELGKLPEDVDNIVLKIQNCLGINLFARQDEQQEETVNSAEKFKSLKNGDEFDFEEFSTRDLTISDLQELKKRKEGRILGEKNSDGNEDNWTTH